MKLSRKSFLILLAAALFLPCVYYLRRLFFGRVDQAIPSAAYFRAALPTEFLDGLVGLIAPGQVRVPLDRRAITEKVIADAKRKLGARARPADAVRLLDTAARRDHRKRFADLSHEQMRKVLSGVLQSVSVESYLLIMLRDEVMKHYYSHPSVWAYLGRPQPPQPLGQIDYDKPPVSSVHG